MPAHLHKVLGDSQSWVVLSGKERGPRARTFFWAGPLGRSGGFGLSGSLLVISRDTLVWQGSGDTHTSPPAIEAAGGLAVVEILCRPSRALKLSASQSPETEMQAGDLAVDTGCGRGPFPGRRLVPQPWDQQRRSSPWAWRAGLPGGQAQMPVSRAESLRSMHSLPVGGRARERCPRP